MAPVKEPLPAGSSSVPKGQTGPGRGTGDLPACLPTLWVLHQDGWAGKDFRAQPAPSTPGPHGPRPAGASFRARQVWSAPARPHSAPAVPPPFSGADKQKHGACAPAAAARRPRAAAFRPRGVLVLRVFAEPGRGGARGSPWNYRSQEAARRAVPGVRGRVRAGSIVGVAADLRQRVGELCCSRAGR